MGGRESFKGSVCGTSFQGVNIVNHAIGERNKARQAVITITGFHPRLHAFIVEGMHHHAALTAINRLKRQRVIQWQFVGNVRMDKRLAHV